MANTVNAIGNNTVFLYFPTTDKFNAKKSSIPATSVTFIADTGQIYANGTMFGGNTTTPKAHDSSTTKYGGATASLYGHVKLFDAAGSQAAKDSAAATPYALSAVSTALGGRISTVESGISDLSTALGRTDGRINTDVINYLSAGTGVAVTNDSDSAGKKYGSISVKAKATDVSTSVGGTTPRVYAVGVDKNGDLAVKVDWSVYTHPSHTAINKSSTWLTGITVDTLGHVTGVTNSSLPTATTSAAGIVRLTDSSVSTSTTTAPTAGALKSVNDAAKDAKATATAAQATANSKGKIDSVEAKDASAGLTATTSDKAVTLSLNMSDTKNSVGKIGTGKVYGVGIDSSGYLAVNVPWQNDNTIYTHPTHTAYNLNTAGKFISGLTVDTLGHVTAAAESSLPAATTSAAGIVRLTDSSVSTSTSLVPTANALKSVNDAAKDAKAAATAAQATANSKGKIDSVEAKDASAGLTATTSDKAVTLSLNMSDTKNSVGKIGTGKVYGVGIDSSGYLAVNVPWQNDNTIYTHPTHTAYNLNTAGKFISGLTVDTLGHVTAAAESSLPAATTSAAGIVRLTDSSVSESTTTAPTAGALKSVNDAAKDAKATATAAQATANSKGVVNTVAAGDGVTVTGGSTADVTVKANLGDTAKLTINTANKVYGVGVDASGKLAVKVPWTDTTANSAIQLTGDVTGSGTSSITTTIKDGAVTSKKIGGFTNSAADFTADASVKVPSAAAVKSFVEGKKYVTSSGVTEVAAGAGLSVSGGTTSKATVSHNTSGVTAGTYRSVTVNELGHVTGGTNPTTISGYGLTDAVSKNGGTLDGNLERRGTSGNTDKGFLVNSVDSSGKSRHKIGLLVTAAEDIAGIYDYTNSK